MSVGTASDLRATREHIAQHARWFEPALAQKLQEAVGGLEHAIGNSAGQQKADAFLRILTEHNGQWAVAARSPRTAERLREGLDGLGFELPVLPVSAMSPDHEYGGILVPAWPNDQRFTRIKNLSVAAEICVLAYPFESKWVMRHQARERARVRSSRMPAEERSSILGIEPRLLSGLDAGGSEAEETPPKEILLDLPAFRLEARVAQRRITQPPVAVDGEDRREAQFVQFFGGCYALLTEWAELPVLNELIDLSEAGKAKLVSATASRLSAGDFVLFRASGDKEITRLIAEEIVGTEEYRRIRDIAERWKPALHRLGTGPAAVQRRLADHGLDRTAVTVAGWLGNPNRIGPGDLSDIDLIASLAGDTELLSIEEEVKKAIVRLRGVHQAAGIRLTKLILGELHGRLNELGDQPSLLDLDYGQAWIVQVELVDSTRRDYPASQVNRLLWTADSAF